MFGEIDPSDADVRHAMQTLRDLGVTSVKIEFSGGNDEGGADGAVYFDANGDEVKVPQSNAYEHIYYSSGGRQNDGWVVYDRSLGVNYSEQRRPATDEEIKWAQVAKVLEHPIYDRWGSFAGEFYVHGTLTWDVAAGKHRLTGQESHEVWDDFDE